MNTGKRVAPGFTAGNAAKVLRICADVLEKALPALGGSSIDVSGKPIYGACFEAMTAARNLVYDGVSEDLVVPKSHPHVGKFMVIDTASNKLVPADIRASATGPFNTPVESELAVYEESKRTAGSGTIARAVDDPENWGSDRYICQIIKVVRPVPVTQLDIKLKEVTY